MSETGPEYLDCAVLRIEPTGPVQGSLAAPPSKSVTNRLLVISALAEGTSILERPLLSDDTAAMATALRSFGIPVELTKAAAVVSGRGGTIEAPEGPVDAGLSGTTLRFLAAVALLAHGTVELDGEPPLRRRPLGGLVDALVTAGARVRSAGGHAPVVIESSGLAGGRIVVDAGASSQFATALLLVAPYAGKDTELVVEHLGAGGYVDLTVEHMRRSGAGVGRPAADIFAIAAGRHYRARDETVEYDASAAAHLFAVAVAAGGAVTVDNATPTLQPDSAVTALFAAMGAEVSLGSGGATTVRRDGPLLPVTADLSGMPDQLPTVAALAALAPGVSRLSGLAVARGHETDRVAAVAAELTKLGADVEAGEDHLEVRGGRPLHGGVVDTYEDHRMAMAFAALATAVPGVSIASPGCVAKTYPRWWADLKALGVRVEAGPDPAG